MLSDITIGQYYRADSVVHKLDARVKIIATILFIVIIFLCKNFLSLALMFVLIVISVLASKVPVKMFLKSLKPIIPIIIFTAAINIFYIKGGDVLLSFWKISITEKGIATALFMMIRIICLIVCSSILTYTTVPTMLTDAIERLLSPLKVFHIEVHTLAMMMTLALRFIPTLIEEIERITNAQKARGADFESGKFLQRIKAMIPILIPLFVSAFSRAYELAFAMSCRCYQGGKGRTRMKKMKMMLKDYVVLLIFAVSTAGVILLNHFFGRVI
ncbi:MAG: energy-coupling factor transporter transmembrane protein EcfT [Faecalibacterium sp.]|nr:energy-coupling factor transporter transmembrane protein EcfT [Ruminococcus sp.]MCM1392641.1 energy-coupling factor transporter transmembrane protein EcfT [Ruminococcus sp.]MCM1486354.1 energy-coupling factor transporter transmembrane protein EcfT [Faecalibacterium sp.]